jgi:hypothetical protein
MKINVGASRRRRPLQTLIETKLQDRVDLRLR